MPTPPAEHTRPSWLRNEAVIAGRLIVLTAAALLAIWLSLQVRVVTIAIFLAFAQAALLWPLVQALSRALPRALASLLVLSLYVATILWLIVFITQEMISALPTLVDAVIGSLTSANEWALERGWELPPEFIQNLQQQAQDGAAQLFSGISGAALSGLGVLGQGVTTVLVATFATLFALVGGEKMTRGVIRMVPATRRTATYGAMRDAVTTARWWFIASTVTGAVDGVFIGLGMHLLGIPLAVPIGLATFILGFIPLVGATAAGIVAILVALFFGGVQSAVYTLILVLAVQQIESNVLAPLLLSRAMQFPPLLTLLTSMLGGAALGIAGLFLAVPTAGIITAAVRGWRRARSGQDAVALPPDEPPRSYPVLYDKLTDTLVNAAPRITMPWPGRGVGPGKTSGQPDARDRPGKQDRPDDRDDRQDVGEGTGGPPGPDRQGAPGR